MEGDFAVNWVLPLVNRENLIVSYGEERSRTRLALLLATTICRVLKFPMVTPWGHIKVRLENWGIILFLRLIDLVSQSF